MCIIRYMRHQSNQVMLMLLKYSLLSNYYQYLQCFVMLSVRYCWLHLFHFYPYDTRWQHRFKIFRAFSSSITFLLQWESISISNLWWYYWLWLVDYTIKYCRDQTVRWIPGHASAEINRQPSTLVERKWNKISISCQAGTKIPGNTCKLCLLRETVFRIWKHFWGKTSQITAKDWWKDTVSSSQSEAFGLRD